MLVARTVARVEISGKWRGMRDRFPVQPGATRLRLPIPQSSLRVESE
jgi:hypothetical protein